MWKSEIFLYVFEYINKISYITLKTFSCKEAERSEMWRLGSNIANSTMKKRNVTFGSLYVCSYLFYKQTGVYLSWN